VPIMHLSGPTHQGATTQAARPKGGFGEPATRGRLLIMTPKGFRGHRGGEQLAEAVLKGKATMSEVRYVELHGSRVAYREAGSGEVVLLIHAWPAAPTVGGRYFPS
jgi:hypothetical protein